MNNRDQRRYQRLTRVQTFGRERASEFAAGSKATALLAQVDQYLVELDTAKAGQLPTRIDKRSLLKALGDDCKNIARTARAIAIGDANFAGPYRLPDPLGEGPLLTHADALLQRLEDQAGESAADAAAKVALRERFLAFEMPADFVQTLRGDREAIRSANSQNQGETQDGVENTVLIDQLLNAAGDAVQALDAIMGNKYAKEPEKLRAWSTASRIESAPQRAKKAAAVETGSG